MLNDGIITLIRTELRKGHCWHCTGELCKVHRIITFSLEGVEAKKISVLREKGLPVCFVLVALLVVVVVVVREVVGVPVSVFMYFTSYLSSSAPCPQVTFRMPGLMHEARDITKGFMASWLKKHCHQQAIFLSEVSRFLAPTPVDQMS